MDSSSKRPNAAEKYKVSPPQAIISTMDPQLEQQTQKMEEDSTTRRQQQQQQLYNLTSPDSQNQRKTGTGGSSRKKIQDFINAHKSRAAQSSRRARSSRRNSNDLTPSDKTVAGKTTEEGGGRHSPGSSSSSTKRRLLFFKKPSLKGKGESDRKQPPSSKSSKRNRACRQQISMEKPISIHPLPKFDDEKPLQQMGVSHVVVKTKLDHKQLEAAMRKRNKKYRFWSIVISLITAAVILLLMGINIIGAHKISEIYLLYSKELAEKSWIDIQNWKMSSDDCLNLNGKSIMTRKGRLRQEISTCERNLIPIKSLPWTEWSECKNEKQFRYRNIGVDQEAIAMNFDDFAQIQEC